MTYTSKYISIGQWDIFKGDIFKGIPYRVYAYSLKY